MLAHSIYHTHGSLAAEAGLGLAGHQQGVHQGLGVVLADAHQQVVDQPPHRLHCGVDACNHLHSGCKGLHSFMEGGERKGGGGQGGGGGGAVVQGVGKSDRGIGAETR